MRKKTEINESKINNVQLYKILLITIKLLPAVIALCYFVNTVLSYFEIDCMIFSVIAGTSLLSLAFMYLCSFVFRFCFYHRLFLHYILINNILNIIDFTIDMPVSYAAMLSIHIIIAGVTIFLIVSSYVKINKKRIAKVGR